MDKISEILNSVKERVSNPLIFSFLISWLVYNWKIPVALIWFDKEQISANGSKSIFDFIEDEWKKNGYFWIPLFIALGYTFIFPIIKNLISATQTWMSKWGENLNLRLSKDGRIGIEKYLKLRNEYSEKIEELESIIAKEGELREYNKSLFIEKTTLDANSYELQKKIEEIESELNNISNSSFLNGQWRYIHNDVVGNKIIENIKIIDGKWYMILNGNIDSSPKYYIEEFFFNKKLKKIIFLKFEYYGNNNNAIIRTNVLNYNIHQNSLEGNEDDMKVKYEKLPDINNII